VFAPAARFERIISVEMFEHMTNWRELMTDNARARMAEIRRPLLPAHLHASLWRLSVATLALVLPRDRGLVRLRRGQRAAASAITG
jgi:hypothetical protein